MNKYKYAMMKECIKESKKYDFIPTICPSCGYAMGCCKDDGISFFACPVCKAEWKLMNQQNKEDRLAQKETIA